MPEQSASDGDDNFFMLNPIGLIVSDSCQPTIILACRYSRLNHVDARRPLNTVLARTNRKMFDQFLAKVVEAQVS